ncbi:MAG: hypothetical protein Q8R34_00405 [bacterium]|nr:hypothetical protein [bacterium]
MERRNNKNGKKMTVDELAIITKNQFDRVDERFNKVDARFDQVDTRLDQMNHTLKNILDVVLEIPSKKAFERLENKVQSMVK